MDFKQCLLQELEREYTVTRNILERIPEDKLGWKPHEKSMSLGRLAMHIANSIGGLSDILAKEEIDARAMKNSIPELKLNEKEDILTELEVSLEKSKQFIEGLDEQFALAEWKLTAGEQQLIASPRFEVIRSLMFNHWYHHRGQLTVYLRLLDIPIPSVYGPTADEGPFVQSK
ncbi:damage-inducible protein DinB [Hazenella sp. IB182353]|uniref:DinB family protein n=1 Tax=Polycladospora coralii TaxID=2771432 RepID=UPI0017475357|nr:DinB family protein [Polycladospora coralii]MBS7529647.1 damage-inducible protein DinB [Polycladospora coralii]